jgi:hypothetical protein
MEVEQKRHVINKIVQEKEKVIKHIKHFFPHDSERKHLLLAAEQGDLSMENLNSLPMAKLLSIFQMLEEKKIFLIILNYILNSKYKNKIELNAENLKKVEDFLHSWTKPKTPIFYTNYSVWRVETSKQEKPNTSYYRQVEKPIDEMTEKFVKKEFVKKPTSSQFQKALGYITSPFSRKKDHVSSEELESRNAIFENEENKRLSGEEIENLEADRKANRISALYDEEGRAAGGTAKAKKRSRKITKKRNKKSKSKKNKSRRKQI